jgi:hypothetical protein
MGKIRAWMRATPAFLREDVGLEQSKALGLEIIQSEATITNP